MIQLSTVPSHTRFHSRHWSSKSIFHQYSNYRQLSACSSSYQYDQFDQSICIVIDDDDDGDGDDDDVMIIVIIIIWVIIILIIIIMIYSTFKNI